MPTATLERTQTVGAIAARHPEVVPVLLDLGLEFCCGGNLPLTEACAEAGQDVDQVITTLEQRMQRGGHNEIHWMDRPLPELIDHIIAEYHEPLREVMPQLDILAQRVEAAHGPNQGPVLSELRQAVQELHADLMRHLEDEEQRLFPLIRQDRTDEIPETVDQLVNDHVEVAGVLQSFHRMTGDYRLPDDACNTWRALWHNLQMLEDELKEHIHLENNVLFPRALERQPA